MARQAHPTVWYNERLWAAAVMVVALAACYGVASLAIDSGSLLQYFIAIVLLILAVNRALHIIINSFKRKAA